MRWGLLFLLILVAIPTVTAATEGKIQILAITSGQPVTEGSVADLSLEIIPGKGRVFLETFPVTKVDTQISMRFAQQFACAFVDQDCSDKDFIYTIRAGSSIIGGPSAGASATALTIALLDDHELREDVAITGTINPGGAIGSVGGIKEKVEAAFQENMSIVLIPQGKRTLQIDNKSFDVVEYGNNLGIAVEEVATVEDMLSIYTGKQFTRPSGEITQNQEYKKIMRQVSNQLCERNKRLRDEFSELEKITPLDDVTADIMVETENHLRQAQKLFGQKEYYAAASFCFRANVNVAQVNAMLKNASDEELEQKIKELQQGIDNLNKEISKKEIKSITDLQTFLIVKERLVEANDHAQSSTNGRINPAQAVALSNERLYSSVVWSEFFKSTSPSFSIDNKSLFRSCEEKIREAEERYQYVSLYLPHEPISLRRDLDRAYEDAQRGYPDLCLFKASRTKADADLLISLLGANEDQLPAIIDKKLEVAKQAILQSQEKGIFPIIGYSYYQYARSLKEQDQISALRFTQYAVELSNIDMYFPKKGKLLVKFNHGALVTFISGFIVGMMLLEFLYRRHQR